MVQKMLATVGGLIVAAYLAALLIPIEPNERQPGTRLAGDVVADHPVNWSFVDQHDTIYVQTRTPYGIPHSVTTIAFAVDGDLYVPCGNCDKKTWPRNVARDPRVRLKIADKLYDRIAVKVSNPQVLQAAFDRRHIDMPGLALYRMDPPGVLSD